VALKSIQPARRRLADEVYDQLIQAIMNREIKPEDRLVQEKLAAELQISRTPVREALMRLEQEGVLEVSQRGSFRLYQMDEREVRELYQARAAIEGQAIRILAERCNPTDIETLETTIRSEESIINTDADARAYFDANRAIHRKFMELAGNRFLLDMFDAIWGKAMAFHLFATIENVDLRKSLGDHLDLIDAVKSGDKTHALEAMTQHSHAGYDLQIEGMTSG
jgi:DNA-binding GntR family transcriptional regulator